MMLTGYFVSLQEGPSAASPDEFWLATKTIVSEPNF